MKVAELIKKLKVLPQDAHVIISSDAEGNEFKDIALVDNVVTHFTGSERFLHEVEVENGEGIDGARKAVVIIPF